MDTKVSCRAKIPHASYDIESKEHCQYPATNSIIENCGLSLKSHNLDSIMGIDDFPALFAPFVGPKSMVILNADLESLAPDVDQLFAWLESMVQ